MGVGLSGEMCCHSWKFIRLPCCSRVRPISVKFSKAQPIFLSTHPVVTFGFELLVKSRNCLSIVNTAVL